jgi:hypothetical protein
MNIMKHTAGKTNKRKQARKRRPAATGAGPEEREGRQ